MMDGRFSMNCRALARLGLAAAALPIAVLIAGTVGVRINLTRSLPVGLYLSTHDPHAPLVSFCPAEGASMQSSERGYRHAGWLTCADGAVPLMKAIVAQEGDTVEVSARGLYVNGKLLPNTAPLARDGKRRPLAGYPAGRYAVRPGTVWVASTYHPASYDSRYFGPIEQASIRDRLQPLWIERP